MNLCPQNWWSVTVEAAEEGEAAQYHRKTEARSGKRQVRKKREGKEVSEFAHGHSH